MTDVEIGDWRLEMMAISNLQSLIKTRFLGALQFWEKRGFRGKPPQFPPTHIVK
jgi:hypothetical protein